MAVLRYPPDLTDDLRKIPYVKFQIVKFRERNFVWDKNKFVTVNPVKKPLDTIIMPLPENVSNSYNMSWEMANMQGVNLLQEVINAGSGVRALMDSNIREAGAALFLDTYSKVFTQQTPNPKKQALFNGIDPRNFTFSYTLSPQSEREADLLTKVIRSLTKAALPALQKGVFDETIGPLPEGQDRLIGFEETDDPLAAFFQFPSEFDISFHNVQGFPKLSTCVCTSIQTNYSPTQMQITSSGHAVQTSISLSFMETELLRKTNPGI